MWIIVPVGVDYAKVIYCLIWIIIIYRMNWPSFLRIRNTAYSSDQVGWTLQRTNLMRITKYFEVEVVKFFP